MEYRVAEDAAAIGRELMEDHHAHLLGVRVEFVFMDKTPKTKGKDIWGRAKKISGLNAFLSNSEDHASYGMAEDYFVIEVSEEIWQRLDTKRRKALIDHELHHCEIATDEETGASKLAIVGHDVTEFEAVLRRHGLWNESVEEFVKAGAEQLSFSDDPAQGDEVQTTITARGRSFTFGPGELEKVAEGGRHLRRSGAKRVRDADLRSEAINE